MRIEGEVLWRKMRALIKREELLTGAKSVLCALSGGADSVALLFAMREFCRQNGILLAAAHLDHGLREKESERDRLFVEALCQRLSIPLCVKTLAKGELEGEKGSIELAAREARYAFLAEAATKFSADRIATAHTASDQAETVLHRLIRGCGAEGLSGIPVKRDNIIRPLLSVTREEVESFLAAIGEGYVTDSTNESDDYTRNRIRHHLMPLCKQENPSFEEGICRMSEALRRDNEALEVLSNREAEKLVTDEGRVSMLPLFDLPDALVLRVLCYAAEKAEVPMLTSLQRTELLALVRAPKTGKTVGLSEGFSAVCRYGILCFERASDFAEPIMQPLLSGENILPDGRVIFAEFFRENVNNFDNTTGETCDTILDCDKMAGNLFLRSKNSGDRIHPKGASGGKSLKKIYIDQKIEAPKRPSLAVLCDEEGICWAEAVGADVRVLADENTKRFLKIWVRGREDE